MSQKQKIDIDIPKLTTFVHKCYIAYIKLYIMFIYLKDILPNYQKNMESRINVSGVNITSNKRKYASREDIKSLYR